MNNSWQLIQLVVDETCLFTKYEDTNLYLTRLPISDAKKADLLSLVDSGVIPLVYKGFYDSLPVNEKAKNYLHGRDILDADTDEDNDEEELCVNENETESISGMKEKVVTDTSSLVWPK